MSDRRCSVVLPTDDLTASVVFWRTVFGDPDFVDGNRWAQFTVGSMRVCLAGESERPSTPTLLLRVEDLEAEATRVGGPDATPVEEGPHERRCTIHGPGGEQVVLYQPLPER